MTGTSPLCLMVFEALFLLFPIVVTVPACDSEIEVYAILPTHSSIERDDNGILTLVADKTYNIVLIGKNFTNDSLEIAFTPKPEESGTCENVKRSSSLKPISVSNGTSAIFALTLDRLDPGEKLYHLCVKSKTTNQWIYKGDLPWLQLAVRLEEEKSKNLLPLPLQIIVLIGLLFLSGLFSGLNLGLMSLDKTEIKIIEKCGSANEKKYAKAIVPLRKRGNYLLCTLLLGNVMVNSTATILMDDLSNGVIAVVASTLAIVIFGEIIPQAVCSRHGLAVGARTAWLTRFFMLLTFPLSFPISLILDRVLGDEIGQVYNREKLQELIRMTADHKVLQNDEANIIAGALQLANKKVEDVMTKMEDVYMLNIDTVLDFQTMSEILRSGYTRVPVYDGDMSNILFLLNTKELALIDPDDNTPLKTVCRFYEHKPLFVDNDMKLDAMLQDFLQGNSHMAIVQRLVNEADHDPYYENIGVVTLEDVIEEIIQNEIVDETDILTDNRKKKPRKRLKELDYNVFDSSNKEERGPRISQQVAFAAYQFLSTAVDPFKDLYITRNVLKQLIRQNVFITMTPSTDNPSKNYIFRRGEECDFFMLLLEGHVEVEIGKENLVFESGPFNYFGVDCLDCLREIKLESLKDAKDLRSLPAYIPDFSVRAVTAVQYLRIRRVHYLAARRTSYMLLMRKDDSLCHEETFHREWNRATASGSISRNNSAAGDMVELGAGSQPLSPLEMVQRKALMSDISFRSTDGSNFLITSADDDPTSQNGTTSPVTRADVHPSDSPQSGITTTMRTGAYLSDSPEVLLTRVESEGLETGGGEKAGIPVGIISHSPSPRTLRGMNGDSPCLLNNVTLYAANCDNKSVTDSESSPDEGGITVGGGVTADDKVPLVSCKDGKIAHKSLSQKADAAVEEEDESCPLVGKQGTEDRTISL